MMRNDSQRPVERDQKHVPTAIVRLPDGRELWLNVAGNELPPAAIKAGWKIVRILRAEETGNE